MDKSNTDEVIARRLCVSRDVDLARWLGRNGFLSERETGAASWQLKVEVWRRSQDGETFKEMQCDYPSLVRKDRYRHESTLFRWAELVRDKIREAKMIMRDPSDPIERERYKIAIAQGHDVRDVGNPTAAGVVTTDKSTWDDDRLRVIGAVDRHSRKRL